MLYGTIYFLLLYTIASNNVIVVAKLKSSRLPPLPCTLEQRTGLPLASTAPQLQRLPAVCESVREYLTLGAEPVALGLCCQFQASGVVHPRAELATEHLALAVAHPAVEVVAAVLRYNINRVCGECWLLHIVKGTMP